MFSMCEVDGPDFKIKTSPHSNTKLEYSDALHNTKANKESAEVC
jgi:hypothetical protein